MAKELKFNRLDRVKKACAPGKGCAGAIEFINDLSAKPYRVIWDNGTKEYCAEKELRPFDTRRKVKITIETTTQKGVKSYRWKAVKNGRVLNHKYNKPATALKQLQQFITDIQTGNYIIEKPGKK